MGSTSKPRVSQDLVDAARQTLEAIPPPAKASKLLSVKDAIKALTPTIRRLLQRGHSREQVVALLREQGIGCSLSTLKCHYRVTPPRTPKGSSSPTITRTMPASAAAAAGGEPVTPTVTSPTAPRSAIVTGAADQKGNGPAPIPRPTQQTTKAP